MYTHAKRSHSHVKDPVVHARVGNTKITQHALAVSDSLQIDEAGLSTKGEG